MNNSFDREAILEAKRRLPLPQLMERFNLGEHAKKSARCPFHKEKNNSFSVWQDSGGWAWKCHTGCGAGDEIVFIEHHRNIERGEAIRLFLIMAGVYPQPPNQNIRKEKRGKAVDFDWSKCLDNFGDSDARNVAQTRGYSLEFVTWLHRKGLLGMYQSKLSFPLHDSSGAVVACHSRLSANEGWRFYPTGHKLNPLIIGDLGGADAVLIFESQWDAFAVADKVGLHLTDAPKLAFIVTRGAGNGKLVKGLIPAGQVAFAWKQNDEEKNGKRPGDEWLKSVAIEAVAEVRWVVTPAPHKDANDWTRAGATANELLAAMQAAVPVVPPPSEEKLESSGQLAVMASADMPIDGTENDSVFYDIARKEYLVPDARGRWIGNNEAQFKRRCKMRGVSTRAGDGVLHSPFDAYVTKLQHERGVEYVGPLAGYPAGLHKYENRRLLVTFGPNLPEPTPGDWAMLRKVLENVLGDPEHDQLTYWHSWLKIAYQALLARQQKPGQALVIVGPAECGKSLLQDLITVLLGGREAKPYRYMTGLANFNGEMVGAKHLRIGDENPHTDIRARRNFGAQIKNIAVESAQRIEAKYYEAMTLKPLWRLTISLNDEPENMLVLPPLDEHTLDKLILFKARKLPMPMPTATPEQKAAFWARLMNEVPHYLHWLLNEFTIPVELVSQRYGVTHFHHPEIVAEVEGFEPHRELRGLIDAEIFSAPTAEPWRGTADELERELTGDGSRVRRAAQKLLDWRGSCARYLGRLAREGKAGVEEARTEHRREWLIHPPKNDG